MRILSTTTLATLLFSGTLAAAERVEHPVHATADASMVTNIVIEIPASSLVITTHADRNVVADGLAIRSFRGEKNRAKTESLVREAGLSMTRRGRTLYIERDLGRGGRFWNSPNATQFELALQIPAGMPVELRQNAGEIDLDGDFGDLDVRLGAGDVSLRMPERLLGQLDAATTVGELTTDLGTRIVEKSGVMAGSTTFISPHGGSNVRLRVRAGTIDVQLTE